MSLAIIELAKIMLLGDYNVILGNVGEVCAAEWTKGMVSFVSKDMWLLMLYKYTMHVYVFDGKQSNNM